MILCLDVGNSHIFGGVLKQDEIQLRFRYTSQYVGTSDQFGLFLRSVLHENGIAREKIKHIVLSSVVPSLDYTVIAACIKYFGIEPFMLKAGVSTDLIIALRNPHELGADRIANAVAAVNYFPKQPLIIVDLGTATTFCAISAKQEYLGGVIMPGMKIAMQSLHLNTAMLKPVEILRPNRILGTTTEHHIQVGIYYGHLGSVQKIIQGLTQEIFADQKPQIIGTGGFAQLFEKEKIFDHIMPDLILQGLRIVLEKNL